LEGLAVTASGNVYINNDNDGVDDNSGEQILLDLGVVPMDGSASEASSVDVAYVSITGMLLLASALLAF
jgi:hypothetical protein